jgi:eukaryotic-like serine/threonine-protein kinase
MPFSTGARFGPYQIQSLLGQGGMGVVYKGIDTRLNRTVALKVLPSGSAAAGSSVAVSCRRRKASALNHPNIVTIYDIGSSDGTDYIAMEYVQGKTLDALIPPYGMKVKRFSGSRSRLQRGLKERTQPV